MKKEKKLRLGKIEIQNLTTALEKDEQKRIKGGKPVLNTEVPIFC
jgi:hypothetical protein